jgi:putative transposase
MSLSASEKVEVIRIVADSELSIRQTLSGLDISRSSFYRWYQDYQAGGPNALWPAPTNWSSLNVSAW